MKFNSNEITKYAVMKLNKTMEVNGVTCELPEGEYVIPVFDSLEKAQEHAGEKYKIERILIPREQP